MSMFKRWLERLVRRHSEVKVFALHLDVDLRKALWVESTFSGLETDSMTTPTIAWNGQRATVLLTVRTRTYRVWRWTNQTVTVQSSQTGEIG